MSPGLNKQILIYKDNILKFNTFQKLWAQMQFIFFLFKQLKSSVFKASQLLGHCKSKSSVIREFIASFVATTTYTHTPTHKSQF